LVLLSNNKLKLYRQLKLKKIREREGKFLIEGVNFCYEAFSANVNINAFLYCPTIASKDKIHNFITLCQQQSVTNFEISHDMLEELSDTVHSQGVLCVIDLLEPKIKFQNLNFVLAIDEAQEPGNVGTIIRTADWFGVDAVLLGNGTVDLYNSKVLRATMGSVFHLPILTNVNFAHVLPELKKSGFTIYAAAVNGMHDINNIQFAKRRILIVGNETRGIHSEVLVSTDYSIRIPSHGQAESLNLAIATGIILNQMVHNYAS